MFEKGLVSNAPVVIYLVHHGIRKLQGVGNLKDFFEAVFQQQELQGKYRFVRLAKEMELAAEKQAYEKQVSYHRI
jgi:hypothetical protein